MSFHKPEGAAGGARRPNVADPGEPVRMNPGARARAGRTGPRTAEGKRRSALNRRSKGLCPEGLERELKARGEDVREFRRLHRDLIGWLDPHDGRTEALVEKLAETYWRKRRRLRNTVGPAAPDTVEIDAQIDQLLQLFVQSARERSRKWRYRLESVFGRGLSGPYFLRTRMEARMAALGSRPLPRRQPPPAPAADSPSEDLRAWIQRMLDEAVNRLRTDPAALKTARDFSSPGPAGARIRS